jgi:hypothetical protein
MTADAAEISVSAVAAQARVHRSFIHRHPDLHAAALAAADPAGADNVVRPGHDEFDHDRDRSLV